ncbi:uncharacterized protein BP5553_09624 [Venustampulla echinocandica]|uniref:Uncharacterized protein n=1 Tax=Venustampulla echinocandica TaxID=2656787 RepID=A0A370TBJ0_9HELO|nr:uncharacterized protein BP5553_09624 [Venustampulla echinocandica]RDL31415.1 hypothetical protein BP5553_09624 [Venustampulla echinocandica]
MADDLRIALGKSKIDTSQHSTRWPFWAEAVAAYQSGWRMPEKRAPVVISPDGPVSTPEKLQELAELPSVPEVVGTTKTTLRARDSDADRSKDTEKVQICEVNWEQLDRINERAECEEIYVWFEDAQRAAVVILSLKAPEHAVSEITGPSPNPSPPIPTKDGEVRDGSG